MIGKSHVIRCSVHFIVIYIYNNFVLLLHTHKSHVMTALRRWFWAIITSDDKYALLPNIVALQVEKHICSHRKKRKSLVEKKPQGWVNKLIKINDAEMAFVYNRKAGCMATTKFMKTRTTIIDGCLQVIGNAKGYEIIRINFELNPDAGDSPEGLGCYYLSSANFERSRLCCVKSSEAPSGWDLLKQAYAGDDEIESGQDRIETIKLTILTNIKISSEA